MHTPRGDEHANAVLTWEKVRAIRAADGSFSALARRFGVSRTNVRLIRLNLAWRDPEYVPRASPHSPYRLRTVMVDGVPCGACRWVEVRSLAGRLRERRVEPCGVHRAG